MTKLTSYQRVFGSGPRGLILSFALFSGFFLMIEKFKFFEYLVINTHPDIRLCVFIFSIVLTIFVVLWSLRSLPPKFRGEYLVTTGAFAYFRHPLYAAFLSCFNFGLAFYLNNYLYIICALILHPLWHWNIRYEESLMIARFGEDYSQYTKKVSRFFPLKFILMKSGRSQL